MSATDELRRLLDERGVEYEDSELINHGYRTTTYYTEWGGNDDGDGANVYVEYMDGTVLRMFDATPEQAIAATLGSGTCEWILEHSGTLYDKWRCSNCGYLFVESRVDHGIKDGFDPNYCPKCGKVVEQ